MVADGSIMKAMKLFIPHGKDRNKDLVNVKLILVAPPESCVHPIMKPHYQTLIAFNA